MATFTDKVVVITGGTSGIGKATALEFAKAGAKVVVSGRRIPEGEAVVAAIHALGGQGLFVQTDVTDEAQVQRLIETTVATYGRLDIAFNNAGVEHTAAVTELTPESYRKIFDANVLGVLLSMKYEVLAMLKTGGGSIINTSSVAGHIGMASVSVYVGAKHAVEGITKAAALEYAKQGIRVNAVAPAAIVTDMIDRFVGGADTEGGKYLASLHPVGRLGKAEEVAAAVLYLASDAASFTTGISLPVDGGWLAQ
ncbi:glucose 1-dehydrogenase [Tuwongella immobilis]|uniref:Ketoreductase domain-containing protein n=1 Tax=Tuwongella immobilis TaxID=692036 RepID=A0A6C2YJ64_9BACT|nr:glucose 1-dehydrogenase [Tuwongella immobilis]VIP01404.1 short-chain dehydrogenase : Short-chain dehydrogenase/reductase SDR OS=Chthoniobacter flavus Ellin428 GN=CfE428DRAFT_1719 PE=4 SV=1: adh_short [Tuwongella immobilis]VTR98304.1 short-chain dehydrogenase : Short-chain dehydrogenase/reductase SDR OS=Chthoniobacter flavus Ellin428 GN=CfE428DRAFT_1719 PE=4 SV=1: adh_short [Tuwongella immobilis]